MPKLVKKKKAPVKSNQSVREDQQKRTDWINDYQKKQRRKGRDIGPLPAVVDPKVREDCRYNLRLFCEVYFSAVFSIQPWSQDHLDVIATMQSAVLNGDLFCVCMPRGSGKTSLAIAAVIWAIVYGHHPFVALIGATAEHAYELLATVKAELEDNELLYADFPEVCHPIRMLEGKANSAPGQLLDSERTRISWKQNVLILPTVPNSAASGSIIKVTGITGRVRGMNVKRNGANERPTLVILDDPQTDDSAATPNQVEKRLRVVNGAVLGLAGPGKSIAGVMPITVIAKDDMADRLLNRQKYPQWHGRKTTLMKSLPTDEKAWERYHELWAKGQREDKGIQEATEYYQSNREALDQGAEASWAERHNDDELSAIQHAMNLRYKLGDHAFFAEYQNEPLEETGNSIEVTADDVLKKVNGYKRGIVPSTATKLTAFVDVQGQLLYYVVLATDNNFSAHVVDYGSEPDQGIDYFHLRTIKEALGKKYKTTSAEAMITAGLKSLTTRLLEKKWQKDDGEQISISRLIVDAGHASEVVKAAIKSSPYRGLMLWSFGKACSVTEAPMNDWQIKPGVRRGWNWRVEANGNFRPETNKWKTFVAQRILSLDGEAGSLSIFKSETAIKHKMFSEHVTSEYCLTNPGQYGNVDIWQQRPNRENHLLDCLVGAYAAASEQGRLFTGHQKRQGDQVATKRVRKN